MLNSEKTIECIRSPLLDPQSDLGRDWDNLVAGNKQSGFMQSITWARFKQNCGQTVFAVLLKEAGLLIGGSLIYTFPDELKPTILVSPHGPVIPWEDEKLATNCLQLITKAAEQIATECNAVCWRIEPQLPHLAPRIIHEFGRAVVNHVPAETLILDIGRDREAILASMKHKCRYNIGLAEKHGVVVREEFGPTAAAILYENLLEASSRDHFYLENREFFTSMVDSLIPSGQAKLLIASHNDETLGALLLILNGSQATYLYGGISNKQRHLMAGYALQWHAIETAKLAGCRTYDFYGYDQFLSPTHPYAKFSRFKSGFGGTPLRFIGAQDYMFIDRLADNIIHFFADCS